MNEAVTMGANLIISYHPPIFSGMKCVTQRSWKERIVTTCLENRIGVFSPHTSYDCVQGGVNDICQQYLLNLKIQYLERNSNEYNDKLFPWK
jgi:putative NIF3 family GTP cyclohydrolase 1 type 2